MTYSIRLANLHDIDWIVKDAGRKMIFDELKKPELYNPHTLKELALKCVREGTALIVSKGTQRIGVIGGVVVPHYLNAKENTLVEIMWYVYPEHRNGRAGYMLIKEFAKLGKAKANKTTLSLLGTSPLNDSTLERVGFKLSEKNYLMEN